MIAYSAAEFRRAFSAEGYPLCAPATARGAFLVSPLGFRLAAESASDNLYMDLGVGVDSARAMAQHGELQRALASELPALCFPGDPQTPDAVFPNNVFATARGRLIVGAMKHSVRRREAARADIRGFFANVMRYECTDLGTIAGVAELTGPLVIDRGRGIGYCGLTERCDRVGAEAMHAAFGLKLSFAFALKPAEYHTNVVMAVLAGRALVVHRDSFVDPEVPEAIAQVYAGRVLWLSDAEKAAFAGNCIALTPDSVWMSAQAAAALRPDSRRQLESFGFAVQSVAIDEIEKAGGSLRCCVAEIF